MLLFSPSWKFQKGYKTHSLYINITLLLITNHSSVLYCFKIMTFNVCCICGMLVWRRKTTSFYLCLSSDYGKLYFFTNLFQFGAVEFLYQVKKFNGVSESQESLHLARIFKILLLNLNLLQKSTYWLMEKTSLW